MEARFDMVRAAHRSPAAALVAAATDMTRYLDTPEEVANSVAFLQMDLSDPDFHRLMVINSRRECSRGIAGCFVRRSKPANWSSATPSVWHARFRRCAAGH